jgi:ParG
MTTKRVSITSKPTPRPVLGATADDWVNDRAAPKGVKRLTFDVSANLHTRIKVACAKKGVKMADALRDLLEGTYPESIAQD